jgi:hypothetical protein
MTCVRAGIPGVALFAVVIATGCGDDALPGCDPDATCPGSTDDAGTTADDGGSSGSASDDDDGVSSVADSTSADDDSSGADTTNAASTGDDTSTGASGEAEYRALALVGALDRVRIFKHDLASDRCTTLTVVLPGSPGPYDVDTPRGWSVEHVAISDVPDACVSADPTVFDGEPATAATGAIEFGDVGVVYPCLVSLDVDAAFAGRLPGIPPMDSLSATDIPVEGC